MFAMYAVLSALAKNKEKLITSKIRAKSFCKVKNQLMNLIPYKMMCYSYGGTVQN